MTDESMTAGVVVVYSRKNPERSVGSVYHSVSGFNRPIVRTARGYHEFNQDLGVYMAERSEVEFSIVDHKSRRRV